MTEADFNQIRLIVTDAIAASGNRIADAIVASEKRMTDSMAASEKRTTRAIEEAVAAAEEGMTGAIAASEKRTARAIEEALAASEKRMTDAIAASEKRLSEALTRAVVELDRRIIDLEKRMIERQDAAIQRAASACMRDASAGVLALDQMTELIRQTETNLFTSFHGYAKGQTARLHSMEIHQNDVNIRLAAIEERILNLETRRPIVPPAAERHPLTLGRDSLVSNKPSPLSSVALSIRSSLNRRRRGPHRLVGA
jgi:hypothetical protein